MERQARIDPEQAQAARAQELAVPARPPRTSDSGRVAAYFIEEIRKALE